MEYKHCCVIDANGYYSTFVLVIKTVVEPPVLEIYDPYNVFLYVNPRESFDGLRGDDFEALTAVSDTVYFGFADDDKAFYFAQGTNNDAAVLVVTSRTNVSNNADVAAADTAIHEDGPPAIEESVSTVETDAHNAESSAPVEDVPLENGHDLFYGEVTEDGDFIIITDNATDRTLKLRLVQSSWNINCYELHDGESLIDAALPAFRSHAGISGYIKPRWNGAEWEEAATPEEIAEWECEHPAPPPPEPSPVDALREESRQSIVDKDLEIIELRRMLTDLDLTMRGGDNSGQSAD